MSRSIDLSGIAILDHHCHTLLRPGAPLIGDGFRRFFAETTDPRMAPPLHQKYTLAGCSTPATSARCWSTPASVALTATISTS